MTIDGYYEGNIPGEFIYTWPEGYAPNHYERLAPQEIEDYQFSGVHFERAAACHVNIMIRRADRVDRVDERGEHASWDGFADPDALKRTVVKRLVREAGRGFELEDTNVAQ